MIFKKFEDIPSKKYDLILIDPPWNYSNIHSPKNYSLAIKYKTMNIQDIRNLNIKRISKNDCFIFLWTTSAFLEGAIRTMEDYWGFKYKTSIVWLKNTNLPGFYFRNKFELCLIGKIGKIKPFRSKFENVIIETVKKHSQKPEKIFEIIDSLNIENKIELFARQQRRGWDSFGDEIK